MKHDAEYWENRCKALESYWPRKYEALAAAVKRLEVNNLAACVLDMANEVKAGSVSAERALKHLAAQADESIACNQKPLDDIETIIKSEPSP